MSQDKKTTGDPKSYGFRDQAPNTPKSTAKVPAKDKIR